MFKSVWKHPVNSTENGNKGNNNKSLGFCQSLRLRTLYKDAFLDGTLPKHTLSAHLWIEIR